MRALNASESDAVQFSDHINVVILAANTEVQTVVPDDARLVLLAYTVNTWVKKTAGTVTTAITVPATSVTDGSGPELNPSVRQVVAGERLHFISGSAGAVSLAFYRGE